MKAMLSTLAAAAALGLTPSGTEAAPVTSSYSGTVTGFAAFPMVLGEFPVGTAVSWEFTFDDGFRSVNAAGNVAGAAAQDISGWLRVGDDLVTLEHFGLSSYTFELPTNNIIRYGAQVTGTGPTIVQGGEFFGLFITIDRLFASQSNLLVGYGFSQPGSTAYSYLELEGSGHIGPAQQVPLPATLWLVLPALAGLVRPRLRAERAGCRLAPRAATAAG